ncbi:hypothetical protein ACLBSL_33910, partial [Klebsiella pneumoniae]|uniref:hypothetical protein n=1 Tax=Klebsiella pneumoniae TaxID=573 RepID=UPI003969B13D
TELHDYEKNVHLGHFISYLGDGNDPKFIDFIKKEYSEIHAYYNSVFNPADFGKNYKTKLHTDLLDNATSIRT